ncbi:hypothetical protein PJV92_06585 [Aliarcobacter butzleri]|uniref:Uncharacterized protein n=2 Tax=Aliarcobacter butzleri TaxID=28197 RepID=A0AAP4PYX6_9BACT|nr:hypothetical protein [Aliarcobacter butzleri]KLD97995.1 hypothetical protein AA20_10160 [Aliarcobacter butzleri L348]MDN5052191.1 hypothetical protein [Aliarcobacter butzleri]MDN5116449.1 hypothetical protein [Aliarcobacter butzleri]MDN5132388.1 hypothetical protein [Aliarcobacter butzleri]
MEQELKNKFNELIHARNDFQDEISRVSNSLCFIREATAPLLEQNENIYKDVSYGFSVQMEELINKINNLVSTYVSKVENIEKNLFSMQGEINA